MSDDPVGKAFDALISLVTQVSQTVGLMLTEVKRLGDRERELSEDVADLGLRVTSLATASSVGQSLRVVREGERVIAVAATLEQVEEIAASVAELEQRVATVHEEALRALTKMTERKAPA